MDKLAWSSCDGMGTLLAWNIFASYLTYYFTDVCGLAVGLAGNIILIARSCDTVTDFLIGIAIDRCHWKSGKYRGWLKIGILPMTIGLPLIFAPWENVSMTFRIIWIALIFGTYGCIWNTIVCAPTHAQLVNMTTSVDERGEIIGIREVFFNIGMFLVSAAFLPLVNAFGGGSEVPPQNLLGAAQLEYRTPDVVIRVNPDRQDLVQTRVLGGAKYLLINVDEGMELNGVSVRVPEEQKD